MVKSIKHRKIGFQHPGKLGEIMSQTSQVLRDMTMQGKANMQMDYHNKIMEMEKTSDPFDTSDRM